MSTNSIHNEYFKWMKNLVCDNIYSPPSSNYNKLLKTLDDIPFEYTNPMDGNRAEDGIYLRYRFGYEMGYSDAEIASYLDVVDCSVLEMMVALSLKCEEIMNDPDIGNRTPEWFWGMIKSLGLIDMNESNFKASVVHNKVDIFMNHAYAKNGRGGLFTFSNPPTDLRTTEIWFQMNWYLYELGETR